ncbi:FmdB family zinc ribbon protein [Salinibacter altiplanensis]|uniref:FmdB family zinc ribbon protein n=1 Tax=Salinibacter altiplanensis TaxID=1803181 RepID=UPI000C9F14C6|nr:FmdB family zinc ribbon protein [Salinibacter altiplanensis]
MPTYTYRREDGSTFEADQPITEDPLDTCPDTGQDVERIITDNPGVIFKGEGFHVNDYDEHGPKGNAADSNDADGGSETGTS